MCGGGGGRRDGRMVERAFCYKFVLLVGNSKAREMDNVQMFYIPDYISCKLGFSVSFSCLCFSLFVFETPMPHRHHYYSL